MVGIEPIIWPRGVANRERRKRLLGRLATLPFFFVFSTLSYGQSMCQTIAGATLVAQDGQYLGRISNRYDSESVLNEYGEYGSKYSATSIWNEYGMYGGKYSSSSPFNQFTSSPPVVVRDGKPIAYLTVNSTLSGALTPYVLKSCEFY
jgi:hypothetical protein